MLHLPSKGALVPQAWVFFQQCFGWSMLTKWELTKWELTNWEIDQMGIDRAHFRKKIEKCDAVYINNIHISTVQVKVIQN